MQEDFREAELEDAEFVLRLILDGARDGHYGQWLLEPEQRVATDEMIKHAIEYKAIKRLTERGPEIVDAVLIMRRDEEGNRVGFLLAAAKTPDSADTDVEIYKCSIDKPYRHRGHARQLVTKFVTGYPKRVNFFARCYPRSTFMISLLKSIGFEQCGTTKGGTILLEKKVEA